MNAGHAECAMNYDLTTSKQSTKNMSIFHGIYSTSFCFDCHFRIHTDTSTTNQNGSSQETSDQ